jgi:hypothetical protein
VRRLAPLVLVLLTGCTSVELDEKWWPLRHIAQSKVLAFQAGARTIGETMYVSDIDKWLKQHPEPLASGTYTHERVHAIRQKFYKQGRHHPVLRWLSDPERWIARWLTDPVFMWQEEQYGYYYHIKYLTSHGAQIVVDSWADRMVRYFGVTGQTMVTKEDAVSWLNEVLAGQWQPPQDVQDQIANPGE